MVLVRPSGWLKISRKFYAIASGLILIHLSAKSTVAVKVFTNDVQNREEANIYKYLSSVKSKHPGRNYIRESLGTFTVQGPKGEHQCLVLRPMLETVRELLRRNEGGRFTEPLLKATLVRLFLALDYLHTEAHLIHTGESSLSCQRI
jgi:serine/threonine-protein kinase SRPK3